MPIPSEQHPLLAASREFADDVLRPTATHVDLSGHLPPDRLTALAEAGLFGVLATDTPIPLIFDIGETLASACLSTAFIWAQHQGAIGRIIKAPAPLRDRWLPNLLAGGTIAGVTYAGLPTHGASLLAHRTDDGGLHLTGHARFVTSWPYIGVLIAWAHEPDRDLLHALVLDDPRSLPAAITPLELIAANASATVSIDLDSVDGNDQIPGWRVGPEAIIETVPAAQAYDTPAAVSRSNATLPLGLLHGTIEDLRHHDAAAAAGYAAGYTALRNQLDQLGRADRPDAMTAARARLLATLMDAATTLYRAAGSRAALAGHPAGRRLREAAFAQTAATSKAERAAADHRPHPDADRPL